MTTLSTSSNLFIPLLAAQALLFAGCSADDRPCGPNGATHGDHCHCDPGYEPSVSGTTCVATGADVADTTGGDGHAVDAQAPDDTAPQADIGPMQDTATTADVLPLAFAPAGPTATIAISDDDEPVWALEALDGETLLAIELHAAYGGPTEPGTFPLTAVEADYASCGTCLILQTGCATHDDHFHCDRLFMPRAEGMLQLDTLGAEPGGRLVGTLTDVVFQEVTIGEDFRTTPIPGGQALYLASWRFDVLLDGPAPNVECDGHGHMHGSECHCDPGYEPSPEDPTRCVPN